MNLAARFRRGVIWSVIGNLGNNLVSFIVFAIVARMVEPREIGVLAVVMVFIEMGRVFIYAGVPDLIVRQKVWDDGYAMMCFWLNLAGACVAVALVVGFVAPAMEASFAPGTAPILWVLAICFLIDGIRVVPESKLRRDMDYKSLARRGVTANLIAGVVAIALAVNGWGIWALVAQRLASSFFTTAFTLFAARWLPTAKVAWTGLVPALGHAAGLVAAAMLKLLSDRLPDLLFGTLLGPVAVGIYRVGARGFDALVQFSIQPVRSTSLSAYAANAHIGGLKDALLQSLSTASFYIFPIFFGASAVSSAFVLVVFGTQWHPSAFIMAALCLACPPLVLSSLFQSALSAQRGTSTIFKLNLCNALSTMAVLLAFTPTVGLEGTTVALVVRSYVGMAFNIVITAKVIGLSKTDIFVSMMPPLAGSAILLIGVLIAQTFIPLPPIAQFLMSAGLGAALYITVMTLVFGRFTGKISSLHEHPGAGAIRKFLRYVHRGI